MANNEDTTEKPLLQRPQGWAVAAAGAAPFAGLIGQDPIIHDPLQGAKGTKFKRLHQLARAAQPGDIVVTTKPGTSIFKPFIQPFTGSEFYHAQGVGLRRGGYGTSVEAGDFYGRKPKSLNRDVQKLHKHLQEGDYSDVVLLRPKQPLTRAQQRKFHQDLLQRSRTAYDTPHALKIWAKEVFLPKIKGFESAKKVNPAHHEGCPGNVCSTTPAQAYARATGRTPIKGKQPRDVFPTDFLRSPDYDLVGSYLPLYKKRSSKLMSKVAPLAARAGLGALTAGAAYGATEKPEAAGAVGGALAGGYASDAVMRQYLKHKRWSPALAADMNPHAVETFMGLARSDLEWADKLNYLKAFGKYRLPFVAGGAVAGYYGIKVFRDHYLKTKQTKM